MQQEAEKPLTPTLGKSRMITLGKSRMISTIISPALQLWLRSQVESGEELQVRIEGGDRQILSGYIPYVTISARRVVYQGLHLSQVHLIGKEIRINLGQVLRGKPLQLLEPVPIDVDLVLDESDLNASLQSPLLVNALAEILVTLLQAGSTPSTVAGEQPSLSLQNPQFVLDSDRLTLDTEFISAHISPTRMVLRTGLQLENDHVLRLESPQQLTHRQAEQGLPLQGLENFKLDLGSEVALQELSLNPGQIACRGCITVIPA